MSKLIGVQKIDPHGWPDWTYPITVIAQEITLGIDIKAQTIPVLKIDIAAQTLTQVNVNIAASAVTLSIDIKAQTLTQLNINIAAQTLAQLNVNVAASAITLNVNLAASAITLNVNIAASAVTLNVAAAVGYFYIRTETAQNLRADIVAQSIGNLGIDIKAQTVGNVAVNIAASAVTLNVAVTGTANVNITDAIINISALKVMDTGVIQRAYAGVQNGYATLYTVPAGKKFYIFSLALCVRHYSAGDHIGSLGVYDGTTRYLAIGFNAPDNVDEMNEAIGFSVMTIPAGWEVYIYANISSQCAGQCVGVEVSA